MRKGVVERLLISVLFVLCVSAGPIIAKSPKVVLVVLDSVSVSELVSAETPFLDSLSDSAAVGLLNTRTETSSTPENGYVSIGSGARSSGDPIASFSGMNGNEVIGGRQVSEVFLANTGTELRPDNVGLIELATLLMVNTDAQLSKLRTTPGLLGQALHDAGLKVGVLGNADIPELLRRQVVTIAMDNRGVVDYGDVSKDLLQKSAESPAGYETDYRKLLDAFEAIRSKVDLCVIELGDTSRLNEMSAHVTPDMLERHTLRAINEADKFLKELSAVVDLKSTAVIITTPSPSLKANQEGDRLTSVIAFGNGYRGGYLGSPSTRWPGIVLNADIAPSILSVLKKGDKAAFMGRPFSVEKSGSSYREKITKLESENKGFIILNSQRTLILRIFTTVQIIIMCVIAGYIAFFSKPQGRIAKLFESWALCIAATPLAFSITSYLPPLGIGYNVFIILALLLFVAYAARFACKEPVKAITLISVVTAVLIIVDLVAGQKVARYSLLSYNPIIGARFYGIGNEYMGILTGATIVGSLLFVGRKINAKSLLALAMVYLLVVVVDAHPGLGADFGGALATVTGLGLTWFLLSGRKISIKVIAGICAAALLAIAGLIALDLLRGSEASHLGRLVDSIRQGGIKELYYVITRKLEVNIRLVRKTIWSRVAISLFLPAVVILTKFRTAFARIAEKRPAAYSLMLGSLACAVVAFAVNDSGIMAADTLLLYPSCLSILLFLELN